MPPGFTAVLMAGLVALAGGELMEVDDSSWWQSCKSPVCSVAETQAEGLARLRVLSNYIKETMTLMGTVIASLDNEMVEVGQELRDIVGRRCHARGHTALITLVSNSNSAAQAESGNFEVISDNDDSWTSGSAITQESTSEWANEVDVESGSSSTTSHRPSSTSHSTLHSTSHSTSHRPSSTSHSTSHASQTQTAASSTGSWRGVSQYPSPSTSQSSSQHHGGDLQSSSTTTTTHGHGKTLHHRPSSTLKRYEAEESETVYVPPAVPGTEDWQGGQGGGRGGGQGGGRGGGQGGGRGGGGQGGGRGGGRWGGGGQGKGHGWGKSHGGGQGLGQGQGQGGLVSLTLGSSGCRGVPVGSPHYVPGLDVWCASNCPAGNCPATHCVC